MILALDQAAGNTGYCVGAPGGPVVTGSLTLPAFRSDIGGLLLTFQERLGALIEAFPVSLIAFEKPVRPFAALNLETARKLYGVAGVIEMEAGRRQITVREVNNSAAKKLCYGNGRISSADTKKHGARLARLWGFDPDSHDQADACAVFLVAVSTWFPQDFPAWEARRRAASAEAGEALL